MKLFKSLGIMVMTLLMFVLVGCTTSFCSTQDVANIKSAIRTQLENGTGEGDYVTPDAATIKKAGITQEYISKKYGYVTETEEITWELILTLDQQIEGSEFTIKDELINTYVDYAYTTYHPKACLTTEENHIDKTTGAEISKKTFGYAVKQGLLEILAWPVSWLFVNGAKLLAGGEPTGFTIAVSIFIVTFLIRGIVLALTFKSTKQSQKMQQLQPEMDAINAKYADRNDDASKNAKAAEMMALYKKYDINPLSSLLGPFITLPIFIAVYSAVKDTTVIFEGYLFGLSMGAKLGNSILSGNIFAIILFVLMGGAQFLSMKLPQWLAKKNTKKYKQQPKSDNPMAGNGQMMTYFFLAMIIVISWILPVAMSVYWLASSLFSVVQAFIMNKLNSTPSKEEKLSVNERLGIK